jgi:division protein CdvB (Snf7/Vps24/ESCRT-III family)
MKFTKNELNLMRYAMYDLLNGDDVPNDKDKFEIHINEIINKIDNELNR